MNKDLVSRQWLLDEYDKRHDGPPGGARKLIEEAPPVAEVRPVVRGEWVREMWFRTCSKCGSTTTDKDDEGEEIPDNFCPACGADMREGNK